MYVRMCTPNFSEGFGFITLSIFLCLFLDEFVRSVGFE